MIQAEGVVLKYNEHLMCDNCWMIRKTRDPVRVTEQHRRWEPCCYCRQWTFSGIFVRDNQFAVLCSEAESGHPPHFAVKGE